MEDKLQVSFKDIFDEIIQVKFSLAAINIIVIAITFFIIIFNQSKWVGSLNIFLLNSIDHDKYEQLLAFNQIYNVEREYLRLLLIEEIADRKEVSEVISKLGIIKKSNFSDEESFNFALRKASFGLEIIAPIKINKNEDKLNNLELGNDNYFTIKFNYHDRETIRAIFEYVINNSNLKVKDFLLNKYQNLVTSTKISNDYKLVDIDAKVSFLEGRKEDFILNRIRYLAEQAEMARNLGIKNPTIDLSSVEADDGSNLTTLDQEQPFYFQGYEAIEKEIELLKKRGDKINIFDNYINDEILVLNEELRQLKLDKFAIQSDFTLQRMDEAFTNSPLNASNFEAVNYDLADIDYKKLNFSSLSILILGLIASIIISFIFILQRIILKQIR